MSPWHYCLSLHMHRHIYPVFLFEKFSILFATITSSKNLFFFTACERNRKNLVKAWSYVKKLILLERKDSSMDEIYYQANTGTRIFCIRRTFTWKKAGIVSLAWFVFAEHGIHHHNGPFSLSSHIVPAETKNSFVSVLLSSQQNTWERR